MTPSFKVALLGLVASPATAFFLMPCWPITTDRIDPIVNPGAISAHVHQIAGGDGFAPVMSYEGTQEASCTTCFVKGDHSNYWIPALYYQGQDGSFERVPQVGSASMYYFNEAARLGSGETMETFPKGLRMLAGDPDKRSGGTDFASQAINYKCLNYAGVPTDSKTFPPANCPDGVRAEVTYPSCWDGVNLDSADHKSHMAYPTGTFESGSCPSSHPHHLVTLKVEFIFDTNSFKDKWYGNSQPFVLSSGDPTGYGLHADYVMGWDYNLLQSAVQQCFDIYGVLANCAPFAGQLPAPNDVYANPGTCTMKSFVNEDIGSVGSSINALPGCNAIQAGPAAAVKAASCQNTAQLVGSYGTVVQSAVSSVVASVVSTVIPASTSQAPAAESYAVLSASKATVSVNSAGFYTQQGNVAPSSSSIAPSSSSVAPSSSSIAAPSSSSPAAAIIPTPTPSPSTTVVVTPTPSSPPERIHIVTVTDWFTETTYYTEPEAEPTQGGEHWTGWKRDIGDGHKIRHRHGRRHGAGERRR